MTAQEKQAVFAPLLRNFETDYIRDYCNDMIAEIPDYIFTMPSSTSGKYHNQTQCQTYGQIYHIYMFASIMEHLLRLEHKQEVFDSPTVRDALRCVPIFHDAIKCGWNGSTYTVQNHPVLARDWVLNTKVEHDIADKAKKYIAKCCEAHSGQWNTNRSGEEIMKKPTTAAEKFVHECDILASRADLDWIISDELKEILTGVKAELPDPETYVLTFGKHKGETLKEIAEEDSQYIDWMKENIDREPLKTLLKEI